MSVWYPDRTPKLVEEFVRLGVRWLDKHPDKATPQRLLLIYAWNENGEGGYLTPTAKDGTEYLKAVQRAIMPSASPAADDGFVSLFDGKTLNGWTICCLPKDAELGAKAWTIDRGTISANTMGHKEQFYIWLTTNKEYGDFVLRLRVQVERKVGNSGIQIRSRYINATGWMEGPQIDIDPLNPRGTTGKLWSEGPGEHRWLSNKPVPGLKFFYADQGDGWNDMEITAKGMKIKSVLNGVTIVDYDGSGVLDDELHRQHHVGTRGVIGLQLHQHDELKLRFKDIWIKEL